MMSASVRTSDCVPDVRTSFDFTALLTLWLRSPGLRARSSTPAFGSVSPPPGTNFVTPVGDSVTLLAPIAARHRFTLRNAHQWAASTICATPLHKQLVGIGSVEIGSINHRGVLTFQRSNVLASSIGYACHGWRSSRNGGNLSTEPGRSKEFLMYYYVDDFSTSSFSSFIVIGSFL